MAAETVADLNIRKLTAEIRKLETEIEAERSSHRRGWLISLSIAVGVLVSSIGLYQTLAEVTRKNRELRLEATVRSQEIFLNQVLDRMSGIKAIQQKHGRQGELLESSTERYGDVSWVGSYAAAVALACEFPHLQLPTEAALVFQVALQPRNAYAKTMLERLQANCEGEWRRMGNDERAVWAKALADNEQWDKQMRAGARIDSAAPSDAGPPAP